MHHPARDVKRLVAAGILAVAASCHDGGDGGPIAIPSMVRNVSWSLSHLPGHPAAGEPVTVQATASDSALHSILLTVDDTLTTTCAAGPSCAYTGSFTEGVHSFSAAAIDQEGRAVATAADTFVVWLPQQPDSSSHSPQTPHWRHMRTSTIDYRIHYQEGAQREAEYDWAAAHFDHVTGGNLDAFKSRNPTIRHFPYDTYWFIPVRSASAAETWLAANGYTVEDAYLHAAGTTKAPENRVTAQQFAGRDYWYYNVADSGFQAWRAHRSGQMVAANASGYRSDGLFFDTNARATVRKYVPARSLEFDSYDAYFAAFDTLLAQHRAWMPSGYVILNQATYFDEPEEQALARLAGGLMLEFMNGPYRNPQWQAVDEAVAAGITVEYGTAIKANHKDEPRYEMTPGNYATVAERVLVWEYASYLMVVDPAQMDRVYFEPYLGSWDVPMSTVWLKAFEHDVGLATAARQVVRTGKDPAGQRYEVFQREFENALVLIRPQGSKGSAGDYVYGEQSAVTVPLPPGSWQLLRGGGDLVGPVTAVELRCGEAVILVR